MHVTLKSLKLKIRNDNHNRRRLNSEPDIGRELPVLERYEIVDIIGSAFPVIFSIYQKVVGMMDSHKIWYLPIIS